MTSAINNDKPKRKEEEKMKQNYLSNCKKNIRTANIFHKTTTLLLSVLLLLPLCGCGKQAARPEPPEDISASPAATATESSVFMNGEDSIKTEPLANDTVRIDDLDTEEGNWIQENLDGSGRKILPFSEDDHEAFWLTNDWFYYAEYDEESSETTFRAPVVYQKEDVVIQKEKKEKLFSSNCFLDFILTDSYIFYVDQDGEGNSLIHYYDLKTKEDRKLSGIPENVESTAEELQILPISNLESFLPAVVDRCFFVVYEMPEKTVIYRVSIETQKATEVYAEDREEDVDIEERSAAICEGRLYFIELRYHYEKEASQMIEYRILTYDREQDKIASIPVVDNPSFQEYVQSLSLPGKGIKNCSGDLTGFYAAGKHFYLSAEISWKGEEQAESGPMKGDAVNVSHTETILIRADTPDDLSGWKIEDGLSDYLQQEAASESWEKSDDSDASYRYNDQKIISIQAVKDNKVFFQYESGGGQILYAVYDLESKKVQTKSPTGETEQDSKTAQ